MSKRDFKIHTPGTEPKRTIETVVADADAPATVHADAVEGAELYSPSQLIDTTPDGLPMPSEVDPTTIRRPVLTTEGWLCPENIRGGGM